MGVGLRQSSCSVWRLHDLRPILRKRRADWIVWLPELAEVWAQVFGTLLHLTGSCKCAGTNHLVIRGLASSFGSSILRQYVGWYAITDVERNVRVVHVYS